MHDLSAITVLQFGTGKFLRAFIDLFLHELAERGDSHDGVAAVQSTGTARADAFRAAEGAYGVRVRGLSAGQTVDRLSRVTSVRAGLAVPRDWDLLLQVAASPELGAIASNVTEAGYGPLDPNATSTEVPPFVVTLYRVLDARCRSGAGPLMILPCELLDHNAARLRELVLQAAAAEGAPAAVIEFIGDGCRWCNTLVDRIVASPDADDPLRATDPLLAVTEPFAQWMIEWPRTVPRPAFLKRLASHAAVRITSDIEPYRLRKTRVLNGAHTALVAYALPKGITTVGQAMQDEATRAWLRRLVFEEIVPTIDDRAPEGREFAEAVLERFANPFLAHRLADIALHHATKLRTRLVPTRDEYLARFGRIPPLLSPLLAPADG